VKIQARELNGHHIGLDILVRVIVKHQTWNKELQEYEGERIYASEYATITMITHKKNGDVNVRCIRGERSYQAETEVDIRDA
jgi:hypothetical protein